MILTILQAIVMLLGTLLPNGDNEAASNKLPALEDIRATYYEAVEDDEMISKLDDLINVYYTDDTSSYPPVILAYKGAIDALRSKHAFWPFDKMSYLNDSMDIIAQAVNKAPRNLEVRFIRFSILYHVPGILGYGKEREDDRNAIMDIMLNENPQLDDKINKGIAEFMIRTDMLEPEEIQRLVIKYNPSFGNE